MERKIKVEDSWLQPNGLYRCPYCEQEKTKKGICPHMWRMHLGGTNNKNIGFKKGYIPHNAGKTNEDLYGNDKALLIKEKLSISAKTQNNLVNWVKDNNIEFRNSRSEEMKSRYKSGWQSTAGRCKKLKYSSNIAGDITIDGTWELKVCKYLDTLKVQWSRNKKRFEYFNEIKNTISTYCPDFFVVDWNTYIEVKGYKTKLDECKWKQFTEPLEIWDIHKLNSLNIL